MLSGKDLLMVHEGCFEILNCDFLIDSNFSPFLMKMSSDLSLSETTKALKKVIPSLISDVNPF